MKVKTALYGPTSHFKDMIDTGTMVAVQTPYYLVWESWQLLADGRQFTEP